MATNIDKSLYAAPTGLPMEEDATSGVEIEIVDPDEVTISADGVEITLDPDAAEESAFGDNLVHSIDESDLTSIASTLLSDIDNDKQARKEWEEAYTDGLKLMGLRYEARMQPWQGASGVVHPMITEAVVRFQSEMVTETFPAKGPVLTKIVGKVTPEKQAAARRVQDEMNYQLTERMVEFRAEHERMLWSLPATGSAFKKVYWDTTLGRQVSVFVPAEDVLLPYGTSNIMTSHRVTHVMRKTANDLRKLQASGFYRDDIDITDPGTFRDELQEAKDEETGFRDIDDERFTLYESQVDLDIAGVDGADDNGIALPYIVTILKDTGDILSIRRNWDDDDELKLKKQHFVHYQYIPGFGSYGFGLFHLIGGYAKSATSIMRQLIDAGTLANLPGGLKSRGLRIKGDSTPISPGEFRDVDVGSGSIRDNILPLPYKEPSNTLFQLLGNIVDEGRRFAATADVKVSDMSAQAPVGTTLAILERQLKVMSAVQARSHDSLKQELKLIAALIREFGTEYEYQPIEQPASKRDDFSMVDVIPVSDPNAATMSQRVVQYQAVIQMAQMAPQIYDLPQLHRGMLDVLGVKNAEKLVPLPDDQKPKDPVTENMAIIKGEPVKAFLYQDHESHIAVHMAAMQDPLLMQLMGQNPKAQAILAAANAHIAEHAAFAYRSRVEKALGMPLPATGSDTDTPLPPEVETALSAMMARAAQQVLQQSQATAQQQQAQQQAQDPVLQMQMQELKLKEEQLKIDAAHKADTTRLREMEIKLRAAGDADRQHLAERKQMATEELNEQSNLINASKVGVMGRSTEAQILAQDREMALKLMQQVQQQNQTNTLGSNK